MPQAKVDHLQQTAITGADNADVLSQANLRKSFASAGFDDYVATEYPTELIVVEESEPLVISGTEIDTLWSKATEIADELGVDRYEIMYVMYEGNKDSFVDNNIHQYRQDADYFVDLSLIENLETQFIINEVKRHIFCRC